MSGSLDFSKCRRVGKGGSVLFFGASFLRAFLVGVLVTGGGCRDAVDGDGSVDFGVVFSVGVLVLGGGRRDAVDGDGGVDFGVVFSGGVLLCGGVLFFGVVDFRLERFDLEGEGGFSPAASLVTVAVGDRPLVSVVGISGADALATGTGFVVLSPHTCTNSWYLFLCAFLILICSDVTTGVSPGPSSSWMCCAGSSSSVSAFLFLLRFLSGASSCSTCSAGSCWYVSVFLFLPVLLVFSFGFGFLFVFVLFAISIKQQ